MMNQLPLLLSIVIPTHQRSQGLKDLLTSLTDQEFLPGQFEILVVSNLKEDPSREICETFNNLPVRWIYVGSQGVNLARNKGLREARADIVLFLDDDCFVSHRYFLQDVLQAHVENPNATAIGGSYFPSLDCSTVEEAYNLIALRWQERVTDRGTQINLLGGNVSYKKTLLNQMGLEFNDHIAFGGAETDFHLRIHHKGGTLVFLPQLNVEHRVRLTRYSLMKKAFRQGMAAHVRWLNGLFEITRPGPTEVVPPAHVQAVVKQFQRTFNWGSQFAKDFEGRPATKFWLSCFFFCLGANAFGMWLWQSFHQFLVFLKIGVPQKPIALDQPLNRYFVLPISKECAHECAYAQRLGCRKVSASPLDDEIRKAKTYGFSEVLLPCNAHQQVDLDNILNQIRAQGLKPVLLLNGDDKAAISDQEICGLEGKAPFHLLLGSPSTYQDHILKLLKHSQPQLTATFFYEDQKSGLTKLRNIPAGFELKTHAVFPAVGSAWHHHPSCMEIYQFLNRASRKSKGPIPWTVRGSSGYWPVERAEHNDRQVWPLLNCDLTSGHLQSENEIQFSILIPTFDSADHLKKVLRAIQYQDFDHSKFEVLILDDGSRDHTREMVQNYIRDEAPLFYLRYFYWPRVEGKTEFRAGLIRNLGVSQSFGKNLCFIDSDILLQPSYLSSLAHDFQDYDVIQAPREMLTEKTSESANAVNIFQGSDIYPDDKYWETFKGFENWGKIRKFWKYTCTYALSVRREFFLQAGWFSPEFFSYGFEDVDLGYRLAKIGARFHLSRNSVFHLYPKRKDFNYHFDRKQRALVLTHSSRVFYRNRLDPEIYREFFPAYYQPLSGELKFKANMAKWRMREKLHKARMASFNADGEYGEVSFQILARTLYLPHMLRWKFYHFSQELRGSLKHGFEIMKWQLIGAWNSVRWRVPYAYNMTRIKAKAGFNHVWWSAWPFISFLLKPYYAARYQYQKRFRAKLENPVSHVES